MQTIGNYLKSGREARNIRLSEVAQSTKISKWYLDCLEKDEFDKIPGGPYIKGYIASYASYIGIEEDEILKRYDSLQINSDDENEVQDHLPEDNKKQNSPGFSSIKKKLLILSMVVFILLAFGIKYFFFQNKTHIVAQLQDAQDSKMQSTASPNIKQAATSVSNMTDLSQNNHLNPIKTEDESRPAHQDAAGTENLALLPSEQAVDGTIQAFPLAENENHSQKATGKEPIINSAPSSSEQNNIRRPALADSKNALHQDTPESADLDIESAPVYRYRTPAARTQVANNMRVIRAVASSEVINKNPAGLSDSFQWSTEKVYIWTMIECEQPPSSIRHTYYFKGQKVNEVELEINSPQWRTWSYKNLLDKRYIGQWRVDITSNEGNILQSVFFEVN
jgi:cytoskeletal protein RodZ